MAPSHTKPFLNFQVDHMTMLLAPELYNVSYLLYRIVFGVETQDVVYNVRKEWARGEGEQSLTFATRLGSGLVGGEKLNQTLIAMVQPTEPMSRPSHVRSMLKEHQAAAHWQHVALRTNDLLAFHKHAVDRGVRFITPILKDQHDDLIQVFSGEWYFPGSKPSGMFFEFVQRETSPELLKRLADHNRETFFRDETFLGLYGEKEREYQSGHVTPFIDFALYEKLMSLVGRLKLWEITEKYIQDAEEIMLEYARKFPLAKSA